MSRPDEGLIHAWLDGELDAAEAARVAALVENDPEWAAAASDARGLIAASARIVGALDNVPSNVLPKPSTIHRQPSTINRGAAKPRHWMLSPRFLATASLAATMLILVNVVPPKRADVTSGIAVMSPDDIAGKFDTAPPPRARRAEADAPAARTAKTTTAAKENEASFRDELARQVPAAPAATSQLSQQQNAPQVTQQRFQQQSQVTSGAGAAAPVGAAATESQRKDVAANDAKIDSLKKKMDELQKSGRVENVVTTATGEARRVEVPEAPRAAAARSLDATGMGASRGPTILSMDDSAKHQCYREAQPPMGIEPIQRVLRMNDTMAFPLALRAEAAAKAMPPLSSGVAAGGNALTNTRTTPARVLTAILRVKGDTLFLPNPNGTFSRSMRVSCPRP